jgi:Ni/Co efflux regulator RcnB
MTFIGWALILSCVQYEETTMKKFIIAMLAATVLVAPIASTAQAQDWRKGPEHHRPAGKHVVIEKKKVVVTKKRWVRGHRMSAAERRHMAEVRDYRRYRLSAPPRGQRWVKVDNDFLLVGITSGVIASIISGR